MKNIIKQTSVFLFTVLFLSLSFTGCDIKNPAEGLQVRIKNIVRETYVSVKLVDAATKNLVTSQVNITFTGQDGNKIVSTTNTPITELEGNSGIFSFAIADDANPTSSAPVKFNMVVVADGYLNNSKPVRIYEPGTESVDIVLTSVNDTPDGVVSKTEDTGTTDGSGGTSQTIVVSSGTDNSSGASAAISLPQGTKLLDGDGNILTGNVQTRVTYFNPLDESSTDAFPGGFNVTVEENGVQQDGGFVTAGFVAIDMTVDGNQVENFSDGGLDIVIEVPQGTMNPETGEAVKVGDIVPLWSYNEDTGEWKKEADVEVTNLIAPASAKGALSFMNGKMGISASGISHLSYFNLDWFDGSSTCDQRATLILNENSGGAYTVIVDIWNNVTNARASYWSKKEKSGVGSDEITLYNFPANANVTIKLLNPDNNNLITEQIVNPFCGSSTQINFDAPPSALQAVTININITCESTSDNPVGVNPDGFPLWAREVTSTGGWKGNWFEVGAFENGTLTKPLKVGSHYEFAVNYDNVWYYSLDYEPAFLIGSSVINYNIIDDSRICDNL